MPSFNVLYLPSSSLLVMIFLRSSVGSFCNSSRWTMLPKGYRVSGYQARLMYLDKAFRYDCFVEVEQ